MKIKEKLETLIHYYETTRQAGHTTAAINGVKNTPNSILICENARTATQLKKKYKPLELGYKRADNQPILTGILTKNSLRGMRQPIVLDNALIYLLCKDALAEINNLEDHVNAVNSDAISLAEHSHNEGY